MWGVKSLTAFDVRKYWFRLWVTCRKQSRGGALINWVADLFIHWEVIPLDWTASWWDLSLRIDCFVFFRCSIWMINDHGQNYSEVFVRSEMKGSFWIRFALNGYRNATAFHHVHELLKRTVCIQSHGLNTIDTRVRSDAPAQSRHVCAHASTCLLDHSIQRPTWLLSIIHEHISLIVWDYQRKCF